jgi:NhaP-type Na+/H+ or K+/H+ antiporter
MDTASWSAVVGLLLIVMALGDSLLARLPLSTSMLYLLVGVAASPLWLGWTSLSAAVDSKVLERIAEIVVLLSLFTSGLKMSAGLGDGRWLLPLRLATLSMLVTAALVTVFGVAWLGLPLGAAVLLGGILAPTDPVLASDVQVEDPEDRDRLRFALTGEAGLNDGTAYPIVLLGLGLLGLHDLGSSGWRWFAVDVLWAVEWSHASWAFVVALLLVIRPISVAVGMTRSKTSASQRVLIGWFGIRGIGSLYYLMFAMSHGLAPALAADIAALVLASVVASIVLHGISVTPLMALYERRKGRPRKA